MSTREKRIKRTSKKVNRMMKRLKAEAFIVGLCVDDEHFFVHKGFPDHLKTLLSDVAEGIEEMEVRNREIKRLAEDNETSYIH